MILKRVQPRQAIFCLKKKGQATLVPEEIAKLVLSIGVIIGLIYLLYLLFSIFSANQELAQAKATLLSIEEKFENLAEGDTTEYKIESPKGWVFVSSLNKKYCICKDEKLCEDKEKSYCIDRVGVVITKSDCEVTSNKDHQCVQLDKVPVSLEINRIYDSYSLTVKLESVSSSNTPQSLPVTPVTGSGQQYYPVPPKS